LNPTLSLDKFQVALGVAESGLPVESEVLSVSDVAQTKNTHAFKVEFKDRALRLS
jgi:hypothetical protein